MNLFEGVSWSAADAVSHLPLSAPDQTNPSLLCLGGRAPAATAASVLLAGLWLGGRTPLQFSFAALFPCCALVQRGSSYLLLPFPFYPTVWVLHHYLLYAQVSPFLAVRYRAFIVF